jgi:hypothetical protein
MGKIKSFFSKFLHGYSFKKLLIISIVLFCTCLLVARRESLLAHAASFLQNHRAYLIYLVPISIALGFYHAATGNAEEQSLYIFKFLGPVLASPLTCLTYAVVINSSIALIYLVCYDTGTLQKYDLIDKTTLSYTLLILVTWSTVGIVKIFLECIKLPIRRREGEIIEQNDEVTNK